MITDFALWLGLGGIVFAGLLSLLIVWLDGIHRRWQEKRQAHFYEVRHKALK